MSARVFKPAIITEMSRNLGVMVASSGRTAPALTDSGGSRSAPNKGALARVRRDLFGPVDHLAAQALAERELRIQARRDAERWGFDFQLEMPLMPFGQAGSRFDWQLATAGDLVPESYALRSMTYLRHQVTLSDPILPYKHEPKSPHARLGLIHLPRSQKSERKPSQESQLEHNCTSAAGTTNLPELLLPTDTKNSELPRKQPTITDFMKSRKRTLKVTKSVVEPPEKLTRNAGRIRS